MLELIPDGFKKVLTPLVAVLLLASAGVAAEGTEKAKKVKVKKIVHEACDGDCKGDGVVVRKIFVGDDGEVREIDGEGHVWVGKDGSVHVVGIGGDGHHAMMGKGGFLGVQLTELTGELREHFGVPSNAGVMVSKVVDDSPAARAGIEVGDIISGVDGKTVASGSQLARAIRGYEDSATAVLDVWRSGKLEKMSAAIESRQGPAQAWMETPEGRAHGMAHPGDRHVRRIRVQCDGGEDCEVDIAEGAHLGDFDCGGASECRVEVRCVESGCECTINGEASDCEDIPGFAEHHGE